MIKISRPDEAPAILRSQGEEQRQILIEAYERGETTLPFNRKIYADSSVKEVLIEMQHGKCCYCEWKPRPGSPGDIEHFRPQKAVQQQRGVPRLRPGYYWLAYEWSNLLFSCSICNREHKRNLFPLRNPADRARNHDDDLSREEPLLINPAEENPGKYISFRRDTAFPIGDNIRGQVTIEVVGLNRPDLVESRFNVYKRMKALSKLLGGQDLLQDYTRDDAEYSAMARAALKAGFSA